MEPATIDRRHPALVAAADACRIGFGRDPAFVRSGGSIPIVSMLKDRLGLTTVLLGLSLPDDAMHAPNERFLLANFFRGIDTSVALLDALSKRRSVRTSTPGVEALA